MIIDTESLDELSSAAIFERANSPLYANAPTADAPYVGSAVGGAHSLQSIATADDEDTPLTALRSGSAPSTRMLSSTVPAHVRMGPDVSVVPDASSPVSPGTPGDRFVKQDWPTAFGRTDSTPSLMSRQLSEWSVQAPPHRAVDAVPTHRRCRSEGVGFQTIKLTVLLPPTAGAKPGATGPSVVPITIPAFYSAQQTIVAVLHECRRRLPSAAWRDLEGAELVLRITEDGEPQFDLPALAAGAMVSAVGESEFALCTKADKGPWLADVSEAELDDLREMMERDAAQRDSTSQRREERGTCVVS